MCHSACKTPILIFQGVTEKCTINEQLSNCVKLLRNDFSYLTYNFVKNSVSNCRIVTY